MVPTQKILLKTRERKKSHQLHGDYNKKVDQLGSLLGLFLRGVERVSHALLDRSFLALAELGGARLDEALLAQGVVAAVLPIPVAVDEEVRRALACAARPSRHLLSVARRHTCMAVRRFLVVVGPPVVCRLRCHILPADGTGHGVLVRVLAAPFHPAVARALAPAK